MTTIDLAQRVHNHNHNLDPFVRSLLDTDFYKLLMAQFIFLKHRDVMASFGVTNRSKRFFKFADHVDEGSLREQLDFARTLKLTKPERIWLQGNTFYGQTAIFRHDFLEALSNLSLPDYSLNKDADGEYELRFEGTWFEVTLWEIIALSILNESRARAGMVDMTRYQLRVLYANATTKLVDKLKRLKAAGVPRIAEFGSRRRHGFLWQSFVLEAMQEELGDNMLGTSNALHAMNLGLESIGTNAHELPMVHAALTRLQHGDNKEALMNSPYALMKDWAEVYSGNLLVALADTFGTTAFLENAMTRLPEIANWRGFREDSKDPFVAGEEKIAFWKAIGQDPRTKLQLFSDGLDVDTMIALHKHFDGRIVDGYGWGTLATNDFRGCDPRGGYALFPASVVCKIKTAGTKELGMIGAVKLSDNAKKITGPQDEVAFYRNVFGDKGVENINTIV